MTSPESKGTARSRITAPCGVVHGTVEADVHVFRGIPYAAPPVGARRYAPPGPADPVDEFDASSFGAIPLQDIDPLADVVPGTENAFHAAGPRLDEDCLTVNVWTPDPGGAAPVYVYVHGGSFLYGSGSAPWSDGASHARTHGLVTVTLNYRLGLLGNLWLGDHDPQATNLGLQDVVAALRWVRENVAAFGGDPDNITVGGESAGGMAISALLTAPSAAGLFRRAVVESGHLGLVQSVDAARRSTAAVLHDLHLDPDGDVLAQLRATSTLRLAAVQRRHGLALGTVPLVADGIVIPLDPAAALASGAACDVDLLIGHTAQENALFHLVAGAPPTSTSVDTIAAYLTDGTARTGALELYSRLQREGGWSDTATQLAIANDHSWARPVQELALLHAGGGGRVYVYELTWGSSVPGLGSAHLVDLPLFAGNLDQRGVTDLLGPEVLTDSATIEFGGRVGASLARFVTDGDLSDGPLGPWPTYAENRRTTMVIDLQSRVDTDRHAERLAFWALHRSVSVAPLAAVTGASG